MFGHVIFVEILNFVLRLDPDVGMTPGKDCSWWINGISAAQVPRKRKDGPVALLVRDRLVVSVDSNFLLSLKKRVAKEDLVALALTGKIEGPVHRLLAGVYEPDVEVSVDSTATVRVESPFPVFILGKEMRPVKR